MQLLHVRDLCNLVGEAEGKSLFRFADQFGCQGDTKKIGFNAVIAYRVDFLIAVMEESIKKPAVGSRWKSIWRENYDEILEKLKIFQLTMEQITHEN